jgi:hypothetical protein
MALFKLQTGRHKYRELALLFGVLNARVTEFIFEKLIITK